MQIDLTTLETVNYLGQTVDKLEFNGNRIWPVEKYGLFDPATDSLIYSWSELISNNMIQVSAGGDLTPGSNYKQMSGKLVVHEDVVSVSINNNSTSIPNSACFNYADIVELDLSNCTNFTTIGKIAFACSRLVKVILPASLTTIGNSAFYSTRSAEIINLSSMSLTTSSTSIFGSGNYNHVISVISSVSESKIQIIDNVYYYIDGNTCACLGPTTGNVKNIHIYSGTTEIAAESFDYSSMNPTFESVDFSDATSLTTIGYRAFFCTYIPTIDLSECTSLTTLGEDSFRQSYIRFIALPTSLTTIGSNAFVFTDLLVEVLDYSGTYTNSSIHVINNPSDTWITYDNGGIYYKPSEQSTALYFLGLSDLSLQTITLSANTTKISGYSLRGAHALQTVNLSQCSRLSSLADYAFANSNISSLDMSGCTALTDLSQYCFSYTYNLTSITLPSGVKTLKQYHFARALGLVNFTVPSTVTKIEGQAFAWCTNLASVYIPTTVTVMGSSASAYAFYNCTNTLLVIYTNASSKLSGWYTNWNYTGNNKPCTVNYNYTYEQYAAAIGL